MSIVSPWIFYLMNLADKLNGLCIAVFGISIMILTGFVIYAGAERLDSDDEVWPSFVKWFKRTITVLIISIFGGIFIPSQDTIYKMLVANYVTYENVETATDAIKDSVDYIFDKINGEEEE